VAGFAAGVVLHPFQKTKAISNLTLAESIFRQLAQAKTCVFKLD